MTITVSERIPALCEVKRQLPAGEPVDIDTHLEAEWERLGLETQVKGKRIVLGFGSRGVARIAQIATRLVSLVKTSGGEPFIVPAMGSHGGATPEGQIEVLAGLGITEASAGCPIHATMDTAVLGMTPSGLKGYIDCNVTEADGLIICNRVKIHTGFHGPHESGLLKMLAIGLGKETGASQIHNHGVYGLQNYIPEVARHLLEQINFVAGFATVEDSYHECVHLEGFTTDTIVAGEQRLLEQSRELMAALPVDEIDVLIVDYMGKNISGSGMDTNIIGRWGDPRDSEPQSPNIKQVVVLDLTAASHGNAAGIGSANFTTRRMLEKTDFHKTTTNTFASGFLHRGRYPLVFETDEDAIDAAITAVYRGNPEGRAGARVVRIKTTLDLDTVWVSESLLDEIRANDDVVSVGEPLVLEFDNGALDLAE